MAITVKHKFVSAIPDGTDATIVRPSNWNDDHDLTGTIPVANGGTGASTLTGYVVGNGTSAFTASSTIPSGDITGLGTMSTQNANAVAITGGSINGTTIGATTASTGAFTYFSTSSTTNTTPVLSYNASNCNFAVGATVSGSYLQAVMQNKSATATASTNWAVSNDLGTDSSYYGEFGMNSSVYSSGTPADFFSLNNGIYFSGHDGDMSIGSGNGFNTYLAWGTTGDKAHVINASGAIGLNTNITGTTNFGTSGQVLTSAGSAATPTWTTPTTGTVTTVSVVAANGFAGTVANASTTPAITLTTSITGILKGNATAISAATAGTDYSAGTSANTSGLVYSTTTTGALTTATGAQVATALGSTNISGSAANVTGIVAGANGGTGVANTGFTITLAGNLTTSGAFNTTLTTTASTSVTLPTTGTLATLAGTETFTNKTLTNPTITNYTETLYAPSAGSAFTVALTDGTVQKFTTNANTTVTLPSSVSGKSFIIIIAYGGAYSVTWAGGSTIKWAGGVTPTATAVNAKFDIFTFFQDGTNTYGSVLGQNY